MLKNIERMKIMKEIRLKAATHPIRKIKGGSPSLFRGFNSDAIRSFGVCVKAMGLVSGLRYHLGIAEIGVDFWECNNSHNDPYDDYYYYDDFEGDYACDCYE